MGQSISLAHLAPFVDKSRQKFRKRIRERFEKTGMEYTEEMLDMLVDQRLSDEIKQGIQTIQYQITTLMTTNGQAPFVTVYMYLGEVPAGQLRDDMALLVEEMLRQRILGVKNEKGVYITPAFPKLIYVLEEDNIRECTKYYYLTRLAAECTAKRMVPDYISEKIMKELKGDVYPCMGCVIGNETISYRYNDIEKNSSFEDAWDELSKTFIPKLQPGRSADYYLELNNVEIYDHKAGWVTCHGMIKNSSSSFMRVKFNNEQSILCTADHPFDTENRGIARADTLKPGDMISAVGTAGDERILTVKYIAETEITGASYDVTTESGHFTVSGIYSHNCRSFLTPDRFTDAGVGNNEKRGNYREGEHRYYGRLTRQSRAS